MKQTVIFDLFELTEQFGGSYIEEMGPHGMHRKYLWTGAVFINAVSYLKTVCSDPDVEYVISNSPEPWVTVGLVSALSPVKLLYLAPGPNATPVEMCSLSRGVEGENYGVTYQVFEEGDRIFINMSSDDKKKIAENPTGPRHTFDVANLPRIAIPDLPAGKNIFIHAKGMFTVMCTVACNYLDCAESISIAAHEDDYVCAFSKKPFFVPGDVTRRTLINDL